MDKDQNEIYTITSYVLNSVSILFSSLLLATVITLRIKEVNFSNRISLRLITYISIANIFSSIFRMLKIDSYRYSMWISYISSWGLVLSTLLTCFLIVSILVNIHLSLIYNLKDIIHFKKYYFATSISVATILSVIPVILEKFAFDQERKDFWYTTSTWEWLTYYGWITLSVLYCIAFAIFVFYRLNNKSGRITSQIAPYEFNVSTSIVFSPLSKQPTQSKLLSKYISRIAFYSLIPILSYSPAIVSSLVRNDDDNTNYYVLDLLSLIFMSSQSTFTFIIFLFDPIVDEVILEHKRNLKHKQNVLDNIKKGVYVNDIYNINLQSNRNKNENRNYKRATIGNRISGITSILYNNKTASTKNIDVKNIKSVFNLDGEEEEALLDLL